MPLTLCLLGVFNFLGNLGAGRIVFESPRLSGMVFFCWLLIAVQTSILTIIGGFFTSAARRLVAVALCPIVFLILLSGYFLIPVATNEVLSDKDDTHTRDRTERLDERTQLSPYTVNAGAFGKDGSVLQKETKILPGLMWVERLSHR